MSKSNISFSLKKTIVQHSIEAKLASGRFVDSGAKYSPQQATADANNSNLRLTASTSDSGQLSWSR